MQLDGRLLEDGTPGYDEARTVWNAMVDRRPRAVVRCANADDVAEEVLAGLGGREGLPTAALAPLPAAVRRRVIRGWLLAGGAVY